MLIPFERCVVGVEGHLELAHHDLHGPVRAGGVRAEAVDEDALMLRGGDRWLGEIGEPQRTEHDQQRKAYGQPTPLRLSIPKAERRRRKRSTRRSRSAVPVASLLAGLTAPI